MAEPAPEGLEVERVDWLASGGRSGLVRVRGRWTAPGPLPDLVITTAAGEERHASLPDPGGGKDPSVWRGAYVVQVDVVAAADRMALVLPSGARLELPAPAVERGLVAAASAAPAEAPSPQGGEVVDRAVLAEWRARRAEAAEQAQARIAREALRAVEVLELRTGQLEEQLEAARAEGDALSTIAPASDAAAAGEAEGLRRRVGELGAELERLRAAPAPEPQRAAPAVASPAEEPDRRVERLRAALAAAIVTIGDLRLAVHEARVQRRTADVEHGADGVRLAVLTAERGATEAEARALRERLRAAAEHEAELRAAAHRAEARAAGAEAAHEESRRRLAERTAELGEARERLAAIASDLSAARAEARAEARRLEAELAAAHAARELAEADAAAATAERQAVEVARAALDEELTALRGAAARPPGSADPPALAELARGLRTTEPERGAGNRLVADLDAAAAALRDRAPAPAFLPPTPPDIARAAEPEAVAAPQPGPWLRGAVVRLAQHDPAAAAAILAGLLPAQWRILEGAVDYDLTIAELGTYAVRVGEESARVEAIEAPRREAEFHLRADALTLAEMLAGKGPRPRRFGRAKVTGRRRRVRALDAVPRTRLTLREALGAGASIDPVLALRCLACAVEPEWTHGEAWVIAHTLTGPEATVYLRARDGAGLTVSAEPPPSAPDATIAISRPAFAALLSGDTPPERPLVRGDHRAVERLREWADAVRSGRPPRAD